MPNRVYHNYIAEILGIDPYLADQVNKHIDAPAKYMGPSHRKVRHSPLDAIDYALTKKAMTKDRRTGKKRLANPEEKLAAYGTHLFLDTLSKDPILRRVIKISEAMLD